LISTVLLIIDGAQKSTNGMVGEGMADTEILSVYPDLELEDAREGLPYG